MDTGTIIPVLVTKREIEDTDKDVGKLENKGNRKLILGPWEKLLSVKSHEK